MVGGEGDAEELPGLLARSWLTFVSPPSFLLSPPSQPPRTFKPSTFSFISHHFSSPTTSSGTLAFHFPEAALPSLSRCCFLRNDFVLRLLRLPPLSIESQNGEEQNNNQLQPRLHLDRSDLLLGLLLLLLFSMALFLREEEGGTGLLERQVLRRIIRTLITTPTPTPTTPPPTPPITINLLTLPTTKKMTTTTMEMLRKRRSSSNQLAIVQRRRKMTTSSSTTNQLQPPQPPLPGQCRPLSTRAPRG